LAVHGVIGGMVWTLLGSGAVLAAMGGMFSPNGSTPAAASTLTRADSGVQEPTFPRVPADSGTGRRIVFDQSDQRVWLVAADGKVQNSSLVTGSDRGNVRAGSYRVQSRTRYARAYNGSGRFEFFVRFTTGRKAPIGFHSVTVNKQGQLVHARADLGTPSTPGCVELWRTDAEVLWDFAPVGTPVVVTA
jgi:lipoprotein-anchoring transpeptidase ErfK/SrfK